MYFCFAHLFSFFPIHIHVFHIFLNNFVHFLSIAIYDSKPVQNIIRCLQLQTEIVFMAVSFIYLTEHQTVPCLQMLALHFTGRQNVSLLKARYHFIDGEILFMFYIVFGRQKGVSDLE